MAIEHHAAGIGYEDPSQRKRRSPVNIALIVIILIAVAAVSVTFTLRLASANIVVDHASNERTANALAGTLPSVAAFDPVTITGTGDQTFDLPSPGTAAVLSVNAPDARNLVIWTLDGTDGLDRLLVNSPSGYVGTVTTYSVGHVAARVQVTGNGEWSIEVKPLTSLQEASGNAAYQGDEVLCLSKGNGSAALSHQGTGLFIAYLYTDNGSQLVACTRNEFDGLGLNVTSPSILVVTTEDAWALSNA